MSKVFVDVPQDQAVVYQDDTLVHNREFEEHYWTMRTVYGCLRDRVLTFKLTRTHLNMPNATFLGHIVNATRRYPCVEKEYPKADVTAVRSFIGMTPYYRNYANKEAPLHALTRKWVNVPAS